MKKLMKNKLLFILITIIVLFLTIASGYLFYVITLLNNIADNIRLIFRIMLILIWILLITFSIRVLKKNKKVRYIILIVFMILYSALLTYASFTVHNIYGKLAGITSSSTTYSSSLVTLNSNTISSIKDIGSSKIGILDDTENVDGYIIPNEIIESNKMTNEIVKYSDYITMINSLQEKEINYIFLPTNYLIMFSSIDDLDLSNLKTIYSKTKEIKNETTNNTKITKPFTVLLMGVDSEEEDIKGASFNGDSLMLITFNPKTLNSTILSIPRDTYVPIACFAGNRKNKITHAAWYGEDCMIKTIQNFTGITIDYYVKINFKGVVKLVDAVNGIQVDVPLKFCEQDSNRDFSNLICLNKGTQTLNGEQALALSRHRKTINDFIRGQNQQLVVKGLINKLTTIRNIDTLNNILDTIKTNMETNMTTDEIFSFYDIGMKILETDSSNDLIGMQRLYISGYDQYVFDYSNIYNAGMKLNLYNFVAYEGSVNDVVKAMKINLGIVEEEAIKAFDFDINNPYVETVIGKGQYSRNNLNLLPNFVGKDKSIAINYGQQNGFIIKTEETIGTESNFIGEVISQTPHSNVDMDFTDKAKGITIKVVTSITTQNTETTIIDNQE